jgi:hypothetical protein
MNESDVPVGSCLICGHHAPFVVFTNGNDDPLTPRWVGCCERCRASAISAALAPPVGPTQLAQPAGTTGKVSFSTTTVTGNAKAAPSGAPDWLAVLDAKPDRASQPAGVQEKDDVVCEHGTAMDVHCCNCHSGFIFDRHHECPTSDSHG